jgi:hypothetical protein
MSAAMSLTHEILRVELGFDSSEWTSADEARAGQILERARKAVVGMVAPSALARAQSQAASDNADVAELGQGKLDALEEAVLEYAKLRFVNPERVMQRRQGSDYSASFSDSSEAATGRREVREILRGAFGHRATSAPVGG